MKLSLMAARADNNVIGLNNEMPWHVKGEQLLFKALTYNQWLLMGRKTYESMGVLPNRKYIVLSRSGNPGIIKENENLRVFESIDSALQVMAAFTDHLIISGGGEIYRKMIHRVHCIHLSTVHFSPKGDTFFPEIPGDFKSVFRQDFKSNIDYSYEILTK